MEVHSSCFFGGIKKIVPELYKKMESIVLPYDTIFLQS